MENEKLSRPKYYENQMNEILEDYIKSEKARKEPIFEELKEYVKNARKNAPAEAMSPYLREHPDGNFRDYLHTIGVYKYKKGIGICAILGAIISVALYVLTLFYPILDWGMATIVHALGFGVVLGLSIGLPRPFFGYTYGIIFCFIGYPIFKVFYNKAVARKDARLRALILEIEKKEARMEERLREDDAEIKKETEENQRLIEKHKAEFAIAVAEKMKQMQNNEIAKNIADWATPLFKSLIDNAQRESHIEMIEEKMYVCVYCDAVICTSDHSKKEMVYEFEKNRCAELEYDVEMSAISLVISNLIKENIFRQYQGGVSQAPFTIDVADDEDNEHSCTIVTYKAKNENYKPIQQW